MDAQIAAHRDTRITGRYNRYNRERIMAMERRETIYDKFLFGYLFELLNPRISTELCSGNWSDILFQIITEVSTRIHLDCPLPGIEITSEIHSMFYPGDHFEFYPGVPSEILPNFPSFNSSFNVFFRSSYGDSSRKYFGNSPINFFWNFSRNFFWVPPKVLFFWDLISSSLWDSSKVYFRHSFRFFSWTAHQTLPDG